MGVSLTKVIVNPGVCGFPATIEVIKTGKRQFALKIKTECDKLSALSRQVQTIDFMQAFQPAAQSDLYRAAAECTLHAACAIPVAIIKALEVEAGLALPRDVAIHFEKEPESNS